MNDSDVNIYLVGKKRIRFEGAELGTELDAVLENLFKEVQKRCLKNGVVKHFTEVEKAKIKLDILFKALREKGASEEEISALKAKADSDINAAIREHEKLVSQFKVIK